MAKKILVVDDDKNIAQFLVTILRGNGYEVVTAMDGTQAVMRAHREKPDLILLDIMMPGGDGFNVCDKLRLSANTSSIPIIVLSASEQIGIPTRARQAGACCFLKKPFDVDDLMARVGKALSPTLA
jgi:DNA-binding response OmpR family regulator